MGRSGRALFLIALALAILASGCLAASPQDEGISRNVTDALQREKYEFQTKAGNANILINDSGFVPAKIIVEAGTYVGWDNYGTKKHRIVADDESFWSEELVPVGERGPNGMSMKFKGTGTFTYHCALHPEMKGEIIAVEEIPIACGDSFCDIVELNNQSCPSDCQLPERI